VGPAGAAEAVFLVQGLSKVEGQRLPLVAGIHRSLQHTVRPTLLLTMRHTTL
jgi:hypothetical protein